MGIGDMFRNIVGDKQKRGDEEWDNRDLQYKRRGDDDDDREYKHRGDDDDDDREYRHRGDDDDDDD
jgi:hypothetical protein